MKEDVKLSMSNVKGIIQLEEGKWERRRSYALNVE